MKSLFAQSTKRLCSNEKSYQEIILDAHSPLNLARIFSTAGEFRSNVVFTSELSWFTG